MRPSYERLKALSQVEQARLFPCAPASFGSAALDGAQNGAQSGAQGGFWGQTGAMDPKEKFRGR